MLLTIAGGVQSLPEAIATPVVDGAGGDYLDKGEALVLQGLLHGAAKPPHVQHRPPGYVGRACSSQQEGEIEGLLYSTIRSRAGASAHLGRWPTLPPGHAIGEVVEAEYFDVHVAAGGMDQVVAPNGH